MRTYARLVGSGDVEPWPSCSPGWWDRRR